VAGIALLDELQKHLILQLLTSRLAHRNHVLNQFEYIVQFRLLPDPHNHFEHFQRLVLLLLTHQSQSFRHWSVLRHQHVPVTLRHAQKSCTLSQHTLEKIISAETNHFVQQIRRGVL
jgi:hypothetical protein